MKQFLSISLLVFLSVSCSGPDSKTDSNVETNQQEKEVTEQIAADEKNGLSGSSVATDYREYDFNAFFEKFKSAVKEGKAEDIAGMTQFPFETRGEMDSDPVIRFSKKEFLYLLPELLNQYAGVDLEGTTEQELLLKTTEIDQEEIDRKSVRVGSLVFDKTNAGWKFTFAYVNASVYKAIHIDKNRK